MIDQSNKPHHQTHIHFSKTQVCCLTCSSLKRKVCETLSRHQITIILLSLMMKTFVNFIRRLYTSILIFPRLAKINFKRSRGSQFVMSVCFIYIIPHKCFIGFGTCLLILMLYFVIMRKSEREGLFITWENNHSSWYDLMLFWLCGYRHINDIYGRIYFYCENHRKYININLNRMLVSLLIKQIAQSAIIEL